MMPILVVILSLIGFGCLALSMARHARTVFQRTFSRLNTLRLRVAGWLALAGAAGISIAQWGVGVGVVFWLGICTVAAFVVAFSLTLLTRRA